MLKKYSNFCKFRNLTCLKHFKAFSNLNSNPELNTSSKTSNITTRESFGGNKKGKFNILFFGNDEISLPTFGKLYEEMYKDDSLIKNIGVITTPLENKKSVQSIFHKFVNEKQVEKIELNVRSEETIKESWKEVIDIIKEKQYNIGIIASFGKMLPHSVINYFKLGAFVMHPSLLPKYRGAAPIQHTLLNREKKTGVSIVEASVGIFDAGNIVAKKEIEIENYHRFKELSIILAQIGSELTYDFLTNYDNLMKSKTPQDESQASKAKLIKDPSYVYLDFTQQPADKLITLYKSFYGSQLEPFTKFTLESKERFIFFENLFTVTETSEIFKTCLNKLTPLAKPGAIYFDLKSDRNNIYIKSTTNWLVTNKIKLDGTPYTPGEKIITKNLANRAFKDKTNKEFNYHTLKKKIEPAVINTKVMSKDTKVNQEEKVIDIDIEGVKRV